MTSSDTRLLESKIRSRQEGLVVLASRSPTQAPHEVGTLVPSDEKWKKRYLARDADVDGVVCLYVEAQGYWAIDGMLSPVIEFEPSVAEGERISRGRMYYDSAFFGPGGVLTPKSADFTRWADQVFRIVKATLTKRGSDYYGEEALARKSHEQ